MLCVLGSDPFGPALDSLDGKPAKGSYLSVRRIGAASESQTYHVLFVGTSENSRLADILHALRDALVLTVGDVEGMAARGIMIEIVVEQRLPGRTLRRICRNGGKYRYIVIGAKFGNGSPANG